MSERPQNVQIIKKRVDSKKIRIVLRWMGEHYVFGGFELRPDGSVVYMHEALNRPDIEGKFTFGALLQEGAFLNPINDSANFIGNNISGIHVTLHPREEVNGTGVIQMRAHKFDKSSVTIARKLLNWEPVKTPFTAFIAISPWSGPHPLDTILKEGGL